MRSKTTASVMTSGPCPVPSCRSRPATRARSGLSTGGSGGPGCEPGSCRKTRPRGVGQLHDIARRAIPTLLQALERITNPAAPDEQRGSRLPRTCPLVLRRRRHRRPAPAVVDDVRPEPGSACAPGPPGSRTGQPVVLLVRAPPVEVSPLLRSSGRVERFSRTARIRTSPRSRPSAPNGPSRARRTSGSAWSLLDTGGGSMALSSFGALDHVLFERPLELLGRALTTNPDRSGIRRTTTSDGRIDIVLRAAAGRTAPRRRWALRGPDYVVEVHVPGAGRTRRAATGGQP